MIGAKKISRNSQAWIVTVGIGFNRMPPASTIVCKSLLVKRPAKYPFEVVTGRTGATVQRNLRLSTH